MTNLEVVRLYLEAIEQGRTGDELAAFFMPGAQQIEYPNRLVTRGATRDLAEILEGAERGKHVVSSQSFAIKTAVESGNTVALEVFWSAKLKVAIESLAVCDFIQAHIAMFIELRDGKIIAQRNYDCYTPS